MSDKMYHFCRADRIEAHGRYLLLNGRCTREYEIREIKGDKLVIKEDFSRLSDKETSILSSGLFCTILKNGNIRVIDLGSNLFNPNNQKKSKGFLDW